MMKISRRSAVAALLTLLLAGCATVPKDGDAVDCDVCDTIWIRLFPPTEAPGIYRLRHSEQRRVCPGCSSIAARYFKTGEIPAVCPRCRGRLALQPVNIAR